jgi:large subunit ribosomal protein L30
MGKLKVQLIKSKIGCTERQKKTIEALGLNKISSFREHEDNLVVRGMIRKVNHLVKVEEI